MKWRPTTRLPISRLWPSGNTVRTVSISSFRTSASSVFRSRFPGIDRPSEREEVPAPVGERGQRPADPVRVAQVDVGDDDPLLVGAAGEDDAPGIDDHRVPVAGAVRG